MQNTLLHVALRWVHLSSSEWVPRCTYEYMNYIPHEIYSVRNFNDCWMLSRETTLIINKTKALHLIGKDRFIFPQTIKQCDPQYNTKYWKQSARMNNIKNKNRQIFGAKSPACLSIHSATLLELYLIIFGIICLKWIKKFGILSAKPTKRHK